MFLCQVFGVDWVSPVIKKDKRLEHVSCMTPNLEFPNLHSIIKK